MMSKHAWIKHFAIDMLMTIEQDKLVTLIECNKKASFSIATTQRCRGGRYFFPRIPPLYPRYSPYLTEW